MKDLTHLCVLVIVFASMTACKSGSIDYEYKFHLDSLTEKKMQWSFTYRDGHSDTWEFFRNR